MPTCHRAVSKRQLGVKLHCCPTVYGCCRIRNKRVWKMNKWAICAIRCHAASVCAPRIQSKCHTIVSNTLAFAFAKVRMPIGKGGFVHVCSLQAQPSTKRPDWRLPFCINVLASITGMASNSARTTVTCVLKRSVQFFGPFRGRPHSKNTAKLYYALG